MCLILYFYNFFNQKMLLRNINDGGILVVEDTHTSYMSGFGNQKYSFINYTKKLIDHINFRFSSFSNIESEKRVWSIQIYESIVAFLINKHGTDTVSAPTDNGGKNDSSKDFRYEDHSLVKKLEIITRYLKYFPGFKLLKKYIKVFLVSSRSQSKKFFK